MKVIFIAYKIQRDLGSEDGSGFNVARRLISAGHEVTLITRKNNAALLATDPEFTAARVLGVDVPMPLAFYKRGKRGIIFYYYLWQITVGRLVSRLTSEENYDVVHQFNFHCDWAPHFLSNKNGRLIWGPVAHHERVPADFLRTRRLKMLISEWSKEIAKQAFWSFDPFLRRAIKRTDIILYANRNVARPFLASREKLRFRSYASSVSALKSEARRKPSFAVLSVGRFVALKGFDATVDAFAMFLSRHPESDAVLKLVGSGELQKHLECRANSLGISNRVRIVQWVDQRGLAEFYRDASVFVYPSFESQGLVVAEAMGAGVPVICLAKSGPEFLCRESGEIVDRTSYEVVVAELAERIRAVYEDWKTDESLGRYIARCERARGEYERRLDWDVVAQELEALYRG